MLLSNVVVVAEAEHSALVIAYRFIELNTQCAIFVFRGKARETIGSMVMIKTRQRSLELKKSHALILGKGDESSVSSAL